MAAVVLDFLFNLRLEVIHIWTDIEIFECNLHPRPIAYSIKHLQQCSPDLLYNNLRMKGSIVRLQDPIYDMCLTTLVCLIVCRRYLSSWAVLHDWMKLSQWWNGSLSYGQPCLHLGWLHGLWWVWDEIQPLKNGKNKVVYRVRYKMIWWLYFVAYIISVLLI